MIRSEQRKEESYFCVKNVIFGHAWMQIESRWRYVANINEK